MVSVVESMRLPATDAAAPFFVLVSATTLTVSSEVLISGPDQREGHDDVYTESEDRVQAFRKAAMDRFGTERAYNRQVINAFTNTDMTAYFINIPKNKLELWFWMESERLLHPVFREFYAERDVVFEEPEPE